MDTIKQFFSGSSTATENPDAPKKMWDIAPENYSLQGPIQVDVSEGDKFICRCGQSKTYPFCDSTHKTYNQEKGTSFTPLKVVQEEGKSVWVCRCGHSQTAPFCDGTHNKLRKIKEAGPQGQAYGFWAIATAAILLGAVKGANYLGNH
ncbi:hypothetical protein SAMD00019534_036850 [Acytostelium subglobosum LB1]|uniref:hypothetical protein n=1 Tax=Acytostelium subglobosum LB1 TaxID=1410327 RepID=UPI0006450105|nr:hypothetical protein SAMD00019534_036850 [Acytostelium subglobosum LB1]GAM20510.1 hypothetical protein SAMD00019534_036850 [Acytostelium subglobosum LB1]|eukprot:XP_012760031.1 hypothetical protein SAMD00019534_036850 [Acytostelium subglobosum LB1]